MQIVDNFFKKCDFKGKNTLKSTLFSLKIEYLKRVKSAFLEAKTQNPTKKRKKYPAESGQKK